MNRPTGGRPPTTTTTRRASASPQEFVRGVALEMRRVTWPTRQEWISATILTIVLVVGIGLFTFIADWLFTQIFSLIHPV